MLPTVMETKIWMESVTILFGRER